jgi:hypothetical protein
MENARFLNLKIGKYIFENGKVKAAAAQTKRADAIRICPFLYSSKLGQAYSCPGTVKII